MGDIILAGGIETIGTYQPIQLYAGEATNGRTTQGTVAAGQKLGKLNARGETYLFAVVALVGGLLVAWDPLAGGAAADNATGTMTFANAVPADGDTVTIDGRVFTFRTVADDAYEVARGATVAESAANLRDAVNLHRDDFPSGILITASSAAGVTTIKAPGTAGNAITLAKTFATGANGTVSGATLSGGDQDTATLGGAAKPYGILPHALDTSASGYNAAVDSPVFIGGEYNFEALDLPAGTTYAEIKAAFARTDINIQRLL